MTSRWTRSWLPDQKAIFTVDARAKSRHLIRALLRESSYLPDAVARSYFRRRILARFRVYHFQPGQKTPSTLTLGRLHSLRQLGWKSLRQLQRANDGYTPNLLKTLLLAYGRTGKKKHELLAPLKKQKPDPDSRDLISHLSERPNLPTHVFQEIPRTGKMLETLWKSQAAMNPSELVSPRIRKGARFEIPKLDIWHRPFPVKRLVNLVKARYNDLCEKTLPPISKRNWDQLERLATGKERWAGPVIRRARYEMDDSDPDKLLLGTIPSNMLAKRGGRDKCHRLTPRYMQHLYREVFRACSLMNWNEVNKTWSVKWGSGQLESRVVVSSAANACALPIMNATCLSSGTLAPEGIARE